MASPAGGVAQGKLRPPAEVAQGRRAVAGEESPDELPERLVPLEHARVRHPFPQQHHLPGRCPASGRGTGPGSDAADRADANPRWPVGGDPGRLERREQFGAGGRSPALEQRRWRPPGASSTVASSRPSSRCRVVSDCSVRAAVRPSIQPMSSPGTRCRVPRIGQDRMISPLASAASTSARVDPGARSPTDHLAPGRSWPCMASIQRTTSAGLVNVAAVDVLCQQPEPADARVGRHPSHPGVPHRQRPRIERPNRPEKRHGPRRGRHRGPCWTIPAQCASRHVVALGDKRGGARGM